jgi:thiamine pyrophosphate-dependent acetolactate synthase large subunit-like protein
MRPAEATANESRPATLPEMVEVLLRQRRDEIVVTTMGAAREWSRRSASPLDLNYLPSSMGQAPALGLGLAWARPERGVWVLNGDGCQLMNLGSLATVAGSGAANLTLFVVENGVYEVTGGQATLAARTGLDFAMMARAAGMQVQAAIDDAGELERELPGLLAGPGPRCVVLRVAAERVAYQLPTLRPIGERLVELRRELRVE